MRARCNYTKHEAYARYGGRGIKVCERWHTFENFLADMGRRPDLTHTLDRIDNNAGYSPDNCRWANRRDQILNSRAARYLEFRGETLNVKAMAARYGLSHQLLKHRLGKGWTLEEALTTPKKGVGLRNSPLIDGGK